MLLALSTLSMIVEEGRLTGSNAENHYQMLQSYVSTVEALLAISIFYRHVMGHMQGAVSFYKSVNRNFGMMNECAIKVGKIVLDNKQQKHLFSAVIKLSRFTKYELEGKTKPNQVKINILYNK